MRTQRASWIALWAAIVVLPLSWGGSAAQAGEIEWVKFDDLADGWRVDDDYAGQGVHFLNDYEIGGFFRASPQITANTKAHTGPNVLVNDYYDDEFYSSSDVPMVIWLDQPAARVGMWLGTVETNQFTCDSVQATVSVYDCAGAFIDSKSVTVTKAFDTPLEIDDPSEKIQKVVIDYGKSPCPEAIDDFAFMTGSGTCTDATPPKVMITSHSDQVVNVVEQTIKGAIVEPGIIKSVKINGAPAGLYLSNYIEPSLQAYFQSYWKFDEGSGTTASDSVGSYDGILVNGPVWTAMGRIGHAISFDGVNDYVETTLNIDQSVDSPGVTILMWVNPASISPGRHQVISTDDGGYDWSVLRVGDKWQVFTGKSVWDTGFSVDQNQWQHVVAVFEPGIGIRFYKNGQEVSTTTIDYDTDDNNVQIGRKAGGGEYFEGKIDEVAIYKRALTEDEISQLYGQSKKGHHYFYPVHDATYYFSSKVTVKPGSNTFTVLARNGADLKGSDSVTLTLGVPSSVSLGQFHLTQRGVMKNKACDVDTPLVAGKSAVVRIILDVKSASGINTYVSSVEMKLWRKKQGGDALVDTFYGTGYSPYLSMFNSPSHMTAIHFWIPGDKLDPAGEYKFVFQPYVGLTPIGSSLVANCGGEYQTFTETRPIRLYLLPVEAGPNSDLLKGTDYAKNLWRMLDAVQRTYPVRDGASSIYSYGSLTAGVKVDIASPYHVCDGNTKTSYCDPGIGYTWRFIDKDPGGLLRRALDQQVIDPNQQACNSDDHNIGGRIIGDPNTTTKTYPFDPNLGIYRGGAHPCWKGAKHSAPQDEDHDGDIDKDDLKRYVAEFYDEQTKKWMTDLSKFDVYNSSDGHGETFRFFQDANGNNCNDSKVETQADIRLLWEYQKKILYDGTVNKNELKAYNEKMPGTQNDADFGVLVFPDKLIASDSSFGDIGPGQGGGNSAWVREGDRSVIAHEIGHCLGGWGSDHDLYRQGVDPDADDLQTKEGAWAVYVNGKSRKPNKIWAVMGYDVKSDEAVFVNSQKWNHYTTLFDKLKKISSTALSYRAAAEGAEEQFVAIGNISLGNQTAEALTSVASSLRTTPTNPESPYKLVFSSGSATLLEYPFAIEQMSIPEGYETWPSSFVSFYVVAPFPAATQLVEVWHERSVLARFERTRAAPSVILVSPNGGESFGASDEVRIRWEAWDPDSEELTSTVYYSPDGGDSWRVLASGILENEFLWTLNESPGTMGSSGMIQVVVSDGFNSGQDDSDGMFAVAGKPPQAVIFAPEPNQVFLQCEKPFLRATAYDPEGLLAQTAWYVDGKVVGHQHSLQIESLPPGRHVIAFEARDIDDYSGSDQVTITVLADSDCDGMSDEFEQQYGLEPGFVEDASWDGDKDGLMNLEEFWLGLDPTNPDTDGDGLLDGEDPDPLNPSPDSACEAISHWDFDGDVLDCEGINHLTNHGAAFVEGIVCQALDFDGVEDYLERDTCSLAIAPGPFTVFAWIKPEEVTGGWRTILEYDRYDGGGPATSWFGIWLNKDGKFHFRVGHPSTVDSLAVLQPNRWCLLTATYNATDSQATLYINGAFDNSAILSPTHYWSAPADSRISIGRRIIGGEYFNGAIDEVMIFDRALDQSEINRIYRQTTCFPSGYSTHGDWVKLGKPDCWCRPYQCDGDADGKDSGGLTKYRVFTGDLSLIVANWKKKAGDPTLNPCADIDHKDSGGLTRYRVFTGDLNILVANWKKKDADLPGDCPRQE